MNNTNYKLLYDAIKSVDAQKISKDFRIDVLDNKYGNCANDFSIEILLNKRKYNFTAHNFYNGTRS